ncbi:oligoendopeptidase F, partial [Mesorhizobium sp. M2D.F.Ca.ET.140.01.1.1]
QRFIDENDDLKRYKFDLKLINEKRPHVLSADKERLLTEAQDALSTPDNVYGMFSNADLEFEDAIDSEGQKHALTQGTFIKCLESDDRVL